MTYTNVLTTSIGKVRLLIPDRVEESALFTDEEINAFLGMETGVKRAAALALETIASDNAMTLKVISLNGLSTNGAQTAASLIARAEKLRAQADADDAADECNFDIAELVVDDFSFRQRLENEFLRNG